MVGKGTGQAESGIDDEDDDYWLFGVIYWDLLMNSEDLW